MNSMKKIFVSKITLNIGVGSPGDKMEKAMRLLSTISGSKPVSTITNKRIPTWGVRPKLAIGAKVTVRGKKANELLKRLLHALDNKLPTSKFDQFGNLSFGIHEYIDIQGIAYDPTIGVIGLEAAVTLERPGFRIKRRTINKQKLPLRHRIKKEEAIQFVQKEFGAKVGEE